MKSDNIKKLISILKNETNWISGTELSKMIHVDKKTIRNYIQELNKGNRYQIESSPKGYKLVKSTIDSEIYPERSKLILYRLLANKDGTSLFDLADEFYVSESTIMNDITTQIKEMVAPFHLEIENHDYIVSLTGKESNKRKLIGYIATHNSNGYFSSAQTLQKLSPFIDVDQVGNKLKQFCKESNLSVNSYALNNLLIHLIIIIIRLNSDNSLPEDATIYKNDLIQDHKMKDQIIEFANKIKNYCFELTGNQMPLNDYNQILLLVSLSIEQVTKIELSDFSTVFDKDFFTFVVHGLITIAQRYNLEDFDNEFICQFYLHSYNLYQRAKYNVSYPNPLASQIKREYAPVYDMAVYYSHLMSIQFDVTISEDEIGFIAFHIGSYIESHQPKSKKISCLIICEDYHLSSRRLIHELHMSFGEELTVMKMLPLSEYNPKYQPDIIISTTLYDFNHPHVVFVNPIITNKNILAIHSEIDVIKQEKKHKQMLEFVQTIFKKEFYFQDIHFNNKEECIRFLCQKPKERSIIDESFILDVLARENFSSTAFTDQVAIPHSINVNASESFIAVLHNSSFIKWDKKKINFVLLIGVALEDMSKFNGLFNIIIDSFSSVEKTIQLLKTKSYEEFIETLIK
ncbi:BglG family transcription antiterminator [Floccifex sp.]|uniref:BglG family transcription antiterminator n=1 Tax=Floccifex sp. TaxID=2815810 RepID=UPI003F039146